MDSTILFIINCIMLGIGLAMDAFSVSMANGLHEPNMRLKKTIQIASTFGFFQFLMPFIGYILVIKATDYFSIIKGFIPYIALILLSYIGINMIREGRRCENEEFCDVKTLGLKELIIQGIATSIDALSVGFTISDYTLIYALIASIIIGLITTLICIGGIIIGKHFGMRLAQRSSIFGGCILIIIGLEIFISNIF